MGGNTKKPADSATRQDRKAKKRKLEDAIPDVPGDEGEEGVGDNEEGGVSIDGGRETKRHKKEKGEKKAKGSQKNKSIPGEEDTGAEQVDEAGEDVEGDQEVVRDILGDVQAPRKSKKERKAERKATLAKENATTGGSGDDEAASKNQSGKTGKANGADEAKDSTSKPAKAQYTTDANGLTKTQKHNQRRDQKRADKRAATAGGEQKDSRFIVFVGNLPFSATSASITKHFAAVKPKSVRHLTQKDDPSRSKGCAFVEFDGYDHMKTALRLFHHSNFDDGVSPARKINVELTAGGGGNTKDRRSKIQHKNAKLNDERARRVQEEEKAKWDKKKNDKDGDGDESGIHPSRRGRVPGGR